MGLSSLDSQRSVAFLGVPARFGLGSGVTLWGPAMSRSAIVNAIFFSVFEFLKKNINALEDR